MIARDLEEDRLPVGRAGFKPVGTRQACSVGSTPTLFRHLSSGNRHHPPVARGIRGDNKGIAA